MIILALHKFCDYYTDYAYETTPAFLSEVSAELGEANYTDLSGALTPSPGAWTVTADDGFDTDFDLAVWLSVRGMVGTFFIVPGWVGGRGRLSWPAVREIAAMGHIIASHSLNHSDLTRLSPQDLQADLSQSKQVLEHELGRRVDWIAYPWGRSNRLVRRATIEAGYTGAVGVTALPVGTKSPRFSLPRLALEHASTIENIKDARRRRTLSQTELFARDFRNSVLRPSKNS